MRLNELSQLSRISDQAVETLTEAGEAARQRASSLYSAACTSAMNHPKTTAALVLGAIVGGFAIYLAMRKPGLITSYGKAAASRAVRQAERARRRIRAGAGTMTAS